METRRSMLEGHRARVQAVQAQVADFYARKQRIRIYHGASNSTRIPSFEPGKFVDTSQLNHVVEVNAKEKYVLVEPSVPMDQLVEATLQHGLIPPVVMEFPGITVGGGIQGGAAESSSFKYGGFHELALEYEMVLGDGTVVTASRAERADLFWGTACTYGSLGVMTLIKLRLISAKPYVRLQYYKVTSDQAALESLAKYANDKRADFIDGILYRPDMGVIMVGYLADDAKGPVATFSKPADDWFYLHARKVMRTRDTYEEYVPIQDYLFRYDRGAFWMGEYACKVFNVPFNRLSRRLLDPYMHTRHLYRGVHKTDISQRYIVQDIFMPLQNMAKFLSYIRKRLGIYPLWLLPMRPGKETHDIFGLNFSDEELIVNVGVWGPARTKNLEEFVALNREIEEELGRQQGRKTLYAHSYYPEDEFWRIYDRKQYDALRQKYKADVIFDDLYQKVTVTNAYKAPISRAVWRHFWRKLRRNS